MSETMTRVVNEDHVDFLGTWLPQLVGLLMLGSENTISSRFWNREEANDAVSDTVRLRLSVEFSANSFPNDENLEF